jgi:hypothetical protein
MTSFFGKGGSMANASQPTRAMGIQLQSSQYGLPLKVVYGRAKIAGNCIWYGDFQVFQHSQHVGKGGGATSTSYTYKSSYMMGLCEGPASVNQTWKGTATKTVTGFLSAGTSGQAPWSHLTGSFALGYTDTLVHGVQNAKLGSSPTLPNLNYEVNGLNQFNSVGGIYDANPADIVSDICTNAKHGVGFNYLGNLTQYSNYCVANGLFLSPVYAQQQKASQVLGDLFKWTNSMAYFSEGQLKVVPLGDQTVTGNGVTYTPNVTPAVDLIDTNGGLITNGNAPPVTINRKAVADAANVIRVEFHDRLQRYVTSAVTASIDHDVVDHGERSEKSVTCDPCTQAAVARFIAQNMLQRSYFIRNTFTFKVPYRYLYLEPTDIVTITDASVDLDHYPVRILKVEENKNGSLTITAEEFPEGIGHSASYAVQANNGALIETNVDPGAVNSPFMFRGPGFLVHGDKPEIWIAVNGSGQYWAGFELWASFSGGSYQYLGTFFNSANYGVITTGSSLPTGSDPDTVNNPTVVLNAPGALLGGTAAEADNLATMALFDTELVAYETATLASANTYQLGYLRRGAYGTVIASHAAGAPFARLDENIVRVPVDPSLIGTTIDVKFLSLNSFGDTPRTLADETAYPYVVGTNVELPDVPAVPGSPTATSVADGVAIKWTNTNPAAIGATSIEYATASGGPWTELAQVGPTTDHYAHHFTTGATYYYRLRARGFLVQSGWSSYTATITNAGKTVANGATVGAVLGPGGNVSGAVDPNLYPFIDFSDTGHFNYKLDNVPNGPNYAKTAIGYVDTSGRPYRLWDSTAGAIRDANYLYVGSARAQTAIDSGNVIVAGSIDFSRGYTGKHLGNIPDDPTSTRYAAAQAGADVSGPNSNLVPDSDMRFQNTYWTYGGLTFSGAANNTLGVGALALAGTGSPSGYVYGYSASFPVTPGVTYTLSGYINASHVTSGSPAWLVYDTGISTQYGIAAQTAGTSGRVSSTFTVPSGVTSVVVLADTKNCTITSGQYVVWGQPMLQPGAVATAYKPSTGDTHTGYLLAGGVQVDFSQTRHLNKNQDNIPDGTTYARINGSELSSGVHKLGVAGSGYQLGDPRNMNPSVAANYVSNWSGQTISYSSTSTAATISVTAATLNISGSPISYGAMSVGVTGSGTVKYFLYVDDPTLAGGTLTLYATTSADTLLANKGRIQVGTIAVTYGSSGTGGGSGGCPAVDAYVLRAFLDGSDDEAIPAGDVEVGMYLRLTNGEAGRVTYAEPKMQPCVLVRSWMGYTLTCSESAPLGTCHDHDHVLAVEAQGHCIETFDDEVLGSAWVTDAKKIGARQVMHITCENSFFWAGDDPDHLFSHHNMKPGT